VQEARERSFANGKSAHEKSTGKYFFHASFKNSALAVVQEARECGFVPPVLIT